MAITSNTVGRHILYLRAMRNIIAQGTKDPLLLAFLQAEIDAVSGTRRYERHWIQDFPGPWQRPAGEHACDGNPPGYGVCDARLT